MDKFLKNAIILILFSLALAFIYFTFYIPIGQDEGVFVTISRGIWNGRLPYRDFFDHKPPGIYFLLMPLSILGESFFSFRLFSLMINIFTSIFIYKISENFKKATGLFSAVSYLFVVYIFEGYYLLAEPFLALVLTFSFYLFLIHKSKKGYFLFGFSLFLALLIKQPAIVSVILLLIFSYFEERSFKNFKYVLFGIFFPFLVLFIWLILLQVVPDFFEQVFFSNFYYPKHDISRVFIRTWTLLSASWYFLFLFFYFILTIKMVNKKMLIFLILLPIPFYLIREYPHYWIQSLPFLVIASSIGFSRMFCKNKIMLVSIFVLFALTSTSTIKWFSWMHNNIWRDQSMEQSEARVFINSLDVKNIYAENRFVPFYTFSNKNIVSKYLYNTEITNHYDSEVKILDNLTKVDNIVILWPSDGNVYSKNIENYVKTLRLVKNFPNLRMSIYLKD